MKFKPKKKKKKRKEKQYNCWKPLTCASSTELRDTAGLQNAKLCIGYTDTRAIINIKRISIPKPHIGGINRGSVLYMTGDYMDDADPRRH